MFPIIFPPVHILIDGMEQIFRYPFSIPLSSQFNRIFKEFCKYFFVNRRLSINSLDIVTIPTIVRYWVITKKLYSILKSFSIISKNKGLYRKLTNEKLGTLREKWFQRYLIYNFLYFLRKWRSTSTSIGRLFKYINKYIFWKCRSRFRYAWCIFNTLNFNYL